MTDVRSVGGPAAFVVAFLLLAGTLGGTPIDWSVAGNLQMSGGGGAGPVAGATNGVVPTPTDDPVENTTLTTPDTPTVTTTVTTTLPTGTTTVDGATTVSTDTPGSATTAVTTTAGDTTNSTDGVRTTVTNTTENVTTTVTDTTDDVENTTDGVTTTVTDTTDDVENTTDGVTTTVTNTTGDAANETVDDVENTTDGVTTTVTNTTGDAANTTDGVTNTTDGVVTTVTDATDDVTNTTVTDTSGLVNGTANLTGNGSLDATETVEPGVASTETTRDGGSGTGRATATDTAGASVTGDAEPTDSSTDTRAGAGSTGLLPDSGQDVPGLPSGSDAALGGVLLVAAGAALASKQLATTMAASQGTELVHVGRALREVGRTARVRASSTVGNASARLARLPRVIFPFGYSRYDDSDPLEHEVRAELFEAVERSPGANLTTLADGVDVSMSTVRHHLRILEEENLLASERIRGQRRYFLQTEGQPELVAALDDPATEPILRTLAQSGPASVSELADELGRDPSTITHHVSRLEDDGLVERERDGRAVLNTLSPVASRVLTRGEGGQRRPVATE